MLEQTLLKRGMCAQLQVFVMCDDKAVRGNRLAMLSQLAQLPNGILDFSELPGF